MKYMYRKIVSLFAVAFLLLGVTGCKKNVNIEQLEKDLVGVWCDELYGYWTSSADSKLGDRWVSEMKKFGDALSVTSLFSLHCRIKQPGK